MTNQTITNPFRKLTGFFAPSATSPKGDKIPGFATGLTNRNTPDWPCLSVEKIRFRSSLFYWTKKPAKPAAS